MKILTSFVIPCGVGNEPLGSRYLACGGTEVGPKCWSPGTENAADTLIQKEGGGLARGQHLVRISVARANCRTSAGGLAGCVLPLKGRDRSLLNRAVATLPPL
jgi:hypothetical protein